MGATQAKLFMCDVRDLILAMSAGFPDQSLPFGSFSRIVSRVEYMIMARAFCSTITWSVANGGVSVAVQDRDAAWQVARSIRTTRIVTSALWDSMMSLNVQLLQCAIDCQEAGDGDTPETVREMLTRVTRAAAVHVVDDFFADLLASGADSLMSTPTEGHVQPESAVHLRISLLPLLLNHMAVQSLVLGMRRYAAALADELGRSDDAAKIAAHVSELRLTTPLSASFVDVAEGVPVPALRPQMLQIVMNSPDFRTMHLRRSDVLTARLEGTVQALVALIVSRVI